MSRTFPCLLGVNVAEAVWVTTGTFIRSDAVGGGYGETRDGCRSLFERRAKDLFDRPAADDLLRRLGRHGLADPAEPKALPLRRDLAFDEILRDASDVLHRQLAPLLRVQRCPP